jgi:hypothetical protein
MARTEISVIEALREAARRLEKSASYQWGHMGQCNCGFLAQVVTHKSAGEIHDRAMRGHGDWSEQLNDYCPSTGLPLADLIEELLTFGFDREDLRHLERLSDPEVLAELPGRGINLMHNRKEDVVAYLRAWSGLLESRWVDGQPAWKESLMSEVVA